MAVGAGDVCPMCHKHELVPHPSDTQLCLECGYVRPWCKTGQNTSRHQRENSGSNPDGRTTFSFGKKWLGKDRQELREKGTVVDADLGKEYQELWNLKDTQRKKQTHLGTINNLSLNRVEFQLVDDKSAGKWKGYCDAFHYVPHSEKSVKPYGRFLRYFVKCDGVMVGIIAVSGSFLAMEDRDKFVGWNKEQRLINNKKTANNLIFCILPNIKVKNLGSFIISKFVRQVRKDWKERYGDNLVLMETLVDPSKFSGVTYRAAGWVEVGKTKGFGFKGVRKRKDGYGGKNIGRVIFQHNIPKLIFVKPLHRYWQRELLALAHHPNLNEGAV